MDEIIPTEAPVNTNVEIQDPPSKELWQHLINDKKYAKSYEDFVKEYSSEDKVDELHTKLSGDKLYTNSKDDFYSDYFPDLKKNKSLSTESQVGGGVTPQSESVSISTSPKETTVTETKQEIKPTTNDLASPTPKDGEQPLLPIPPGSKPPTKNVISAIKDKDQLELNKLLAFTPQEREGYQKQIDDNQTYLDGIKIDNKKANDIKKELSKIPDSYLNTVYQTDDDGTEHNMKEYLSNARENNYPFYKLFLANLKIQDMLEFNPKENGAKIQDAFNQNNLGVLTTSPGDESYNIVNESEYVKSEYNRLKGIVKTNGADAGKANEDLKRLQNNPLDYFKGNEAALKDIDKIAKETPLTNVKVGLYIPTNPTQVVDVLQNLDDYTTNASNIIINATRGGGGLQSEGLATLGDGAVEFVKEYVDPGSASEYIKRKINNSQYVGETKGTLEYKPGMYEENPTPPDETNNEISNPYQSLIEKKEGTLKDDNNLNNYTLESIRQKLNPNSLIDKLSFDIYAHSVGIDDAIMKTSDTPENTDKIADAAINYGLSVDPNLKKQYEALGNKLPEDVVAKLKMDFMNDPYVKAIMGDPAQKLRIRQEYKERTGKDVSNDMFNTTLLDEGKAKFIKDFKQFAVKDVAAKISNERQVRGMGNSILDIPTRDETNMLVDSMVANKQLTPEEGELYKTDISQDISAFRSVASQSTTLIGGGTIFFKNPIQTYDFFGQAQQGWGQGLINTAKSIIEWTGMTTAGQMIQDAGAGDIMTKNHALARMMSDAVVTKFVPNEASAVWGNMGNTTGFLAFLIAGGAELKTLGLSADVAHSLSAASVFYSTNSERALMAFPGDDMKDMVMRKASTFTHTAIDVFFIKALPKGGITGKMRDVLTDDVNATFQELKSGVITGAEASTKINSRIYSTVKNILGASVNTANVMTGLSATQQAVSSFLGENNKDVSDIVNEGVDNYLPTMLSTAVVSTYAGITEKGAKLNGENITDLAKNYDYFSDRLDKMIEANPKSKKDVDDMRNNLNAIRDAYNTVQDVSFKDLSAEQKQKYIALSLLENANMSKSTSTSDVAASKKFADNANKIREQKTEILNNKDKAAEHNQYTITLPKNETDDTANQTGISSGIGAGKTSEQTQSQQGTVTETTGTGGVLQTQGTEGEGAGTNKKEVKSQKNDDTERVIANIKDLLSVYKTSKEKYEYLKNMTPEERKENLGKLDMDMNKYKSMHDAKLNQIAEWITPLLNSLGYEVKANTDATKLLDNIDLNKIVSSKTGESKTLTTEGVGQQVGEVEIPQQKGVGVGEAKTEGTTINVGGDFTTTKTGGERKDVSWKTGESQTLTNEMGEETKGEKEEGENIFEEEKRTTFKHKGLQEVATEYGLDDIGSREKKNDLRLFKDAETTIDSWVADGTYEDNVSKIIQTAEGKQPLSDEQNVILSQHISNLRADMKGMDINSPEYDTKLNELQRVIKAGEATRSAQGAALRVPLLSTKAKYDLPIMLAQKMADLNVDELTPTQKSDIKKQYEDIQAKLDIAEEKNRILEEKIAEAKAQKEINKTTTGGSKKTNKTNDDFKKERQTLKEKLAEQLGITKPKTTDETSNKPNDETKTSVKFEDKNVPSPKLETTISGTSATTTTTSGSNATTTQKGGETSTSTSTGTSTEGEKGPGDKKKITPGIAKTISEIVQSHLEESKTKDLKEVTENTVNDIKDIFPNITSKDVHDIIAGKYSAKKKTKSQLQSDWKSLKEEAKLINELESLLAGDETKLTEKQKVEKNQKIKDLKDKIKSYKEESGIADTERVNKAEIVAQKNIQDLEDKIDNNDLEFDKIKKPTSIQLEEYRTKQKQLRDELEGMRKDAKVGKYSDESKIQAAETQAKKTIQNLEDKIDNNDLEFDKIDKPTSIQLKEYRAKQKQLREELDQKRKEAKIGKYSDAEKLNKAEENALTTVIKLEEKIQNNDLEFDKIDKPTSEQLEDYRNQQKQLRKELEQKRKDAKVGKYSDASKIQSAETQAQKTIQDLEDKIDNNDLEFDKIDKPTSTQLENYRAKQKQLRKDLEQKRKDAKVGKYSDAAKIKLAEENALTTVIKLEEKIQNNDLEFDKIDKPTSTELEDYRNQQKQLRKELEQKRKDAKIGKYSDASKIQLAEEQAQKNIQDLQDKIDNNDLEFDKIDKPTSTQLEDYRNQQKQLRKDLEQKRKEAKVGKYSDASKIKSAEETATENIKKLEQDIAQNKLEVEQAEKVNSPKLEQLREKQKELIKQKEQLRKEQKTGRYSDLAKLKALKEANLKAAQKIKDKTAQGDFEPEQKTPFLDDLNLAKNHPVEYKEAMDAIRAKEDAQYEYERERMRDKLSKQPKVVKWIVDPVKMAINTITAIKAGIDNSFAFVQAGITILNPFNIKSTVKSFKEQTLDFFSQARFERELANLHNNKALWSLIEKSGLDILDPKSLSESKKDEVFGKRSFLNTPIKIAGKSYVAGKYTTAPFERLYTSLGNNLRLNLFLTRCAELQADGKTPETNPQDYKDAARTINEMTGRGKIHKGLSKSTEAISAVVWSPKMLASSLNVLGLGDIINAANPTGEKGYYSSLGGSKVNLKSIDGIKGSASDFYNSPRGYALRQSISGIGGALSLMYLWSLNPDKEVDLDPHSVSFGTVKDKNSGNSYSVLGRYTSIIRMVSMLMTGEKKSGARTIELDDSKTFSNKRLEEVYKFGRGKFNPAAGEITDFIMQRTYDGKPYALTGSGERLFVPMSVTEIAKGLEQQGWAGIFKRGFPAFYGVKVTNQSDFANPLYTAEEINSNPTLSTIIQGQIYIPALKKIDEIELDKDAKHPSGQLSESEYKEYVQFKKDRFKEKVKEILDSKWEGTNVKTEEVVYSTAQGLNQITTDKNGIIITKLQDVIDQANKKIDTEFFEKKGIKKPITKEVEWKPIQGDIFTPEQKKQEHFKVYDEAGIKIPDMKIKSEIEIDQDDKHQNKEMTPEEYETFKKEVAEKYDRELRKVLYSWYETPNISASGTEIGVKGSIGKNLFKQKVKKGSKETNALQVIVDDKYNDVIKEVLEKMKLKKQKVSKAWTTSN